MNKSIVKASRQVRPHGSFAVHFRCDTCGKIQPVRIISPDGMMELLTQPVLLSGEHICQSCLDKIEREMEVEIFG